MSRKTPPWIALRKKSLPELPLEPPIQLGPHSNGEFYLDSTPLQRRIRSEILRVAEEKARRAGMDRRAFLASTMGMATSLSVLNLAAGCGKDGGYQVSDASTLDPECAGQVLAGNELIVYAHTHLIEDEAAWREYHPTGVYDADPFASIITFFDSGPLMPARPSDCIDPHST